MSERLAVASTAVLLMLIAVLFVMSARITVLPVRVTAAQKQVPGPPGATCREFQATKTVGLMAEASLPLHAVVCWNGHRASEIWGLNQSDCELGTSTMARVERLHCSRTADRDGTIRFVYEAAIRPTLLPTVARRVSLKLAVTKSGGVLEFP